MSLMIKIGVLQLAPEKLQQMIHDEWNDRRVNADGTLKIAYSATEQFRTLQGRVEEFTKEYVNGIRNKIEGRHRISRDEIDNIRTLEKLMIGMRYDPQGDHYKRHIRALEMPTTPHQALWHNMATKARHAGLLEGSDRSERVRVERTHDTHFTVN